MIEYQKGGKMIVYQKGGERDTRSGKRRRLQWLSQASGRHHTQANRCDGVIISPQSEQSEQGGFLFMSSGSEWLLLSVWERLL